MDGIAWTPPSVAVYSASEAHTHRARTLAAELGLELVTSPKSAHNMLLVVTPSGMELRDRTKPRGLAVMADFVAAGKSHLRHRHSFFRQPIAKAVLASVSPLVWDATAGLGQDAWLLACMGCRVVAIERSPILGVMLHDALARAREQLAPEVGSDFQVVVADARRLLREVPPDEAPDVIYMDPMFGARRRKTALAKKEMRVLGRLIGSDPDACELFEAATRVARRRVVVKRRAGASPLVREPDTEYAGKIARYDVYFTRNVVIPSDLDYGEGDEFELGEAYDETSATDRTSDSDNDDSSDEPIPY